MSPHYRAISIFTCTRALCYNRPALTGSMASTLGASLAQSRLDYANYIMYGMSASNMHELRFAQNALAREVLPSFRHLSASEWHSYLHWLSVHYRILFKMVTLTYTTVATCHPSYLWIISSKYTSHHELSVLQPRNFYRCHILVQWFRSARLQLQLSCSSIEFNSYFLLKLFLSI